MFSKIMSFGIAGLDAYPIAIEADVADGLPCFTIVGLPDNSVRESRERVRSAIKNSGYAFPGGRITVNLSPADTRKEGSAFDLAIALSIMAACGYITNESLNGYAFLGEVSLDGSILPINGSLAFAMAGDPKSCRGLIVPLANAQEAALAQNVPIYPVQNIKQLVADLLTPTEMVPTKAIHPPVKTQQAIHLDFSDVKGQGSVKRGLEIAAAGGHNVLLIGPPGAGKTMLAKRISGILPEMSLPEALDVTKIYSVAGLMPPQMYIVQHRPFRCPHHTCSDIALIGGGSNPKAGEVTLAHHGILFLDELPEFSRHVLEVLRQPLEDHCVTIARALRTIKFPAKFMLVAAMNPCPCGWRMGGKKPCSCSSVQIDRYMNKISGPLLDRIDIHLEVPALKTNDLFITIDAEPSSAIKKRTTASRTIQGARLKEDHIHANAQMTTRLLKKYCPLNTECNQLLKQAVEILGLSGRAHDKILKVARTIADLDNSDDIKPPHLAEAIGYRTLDRMK